MRGSLRSVLAVLAVVALSACGSGPGATTKKFVEAVDRKEFSTAKEYMTPESASIFDMALALGGKKLMERNGSSGPFTVASERIEGETATVVVKNAKGEEQSFDLRKIDGKWKVAFSK